MEEAVSTLGHSGEAVWPKCPPRSRSVPVLSSRVSPARDATQMGSENSSYSAVFPQPCPAKMNTMWILIPAGSKASFTITMAQFGSIGKLSCFDLCFCLRIGEQICKNLWKMMPQIHTNWTAHCVPALSFLELAHTVSASHGRGMFFNGAVGWQVLTNSSGDPI